MKEKNLFVFDIDGTLTDSVSIHQTAFIDSLKEMGINQEGINFSGFKHHTDSFIAKEIYENRGERLFDENRREEFEELLTQKVASQKIREIPGAKKTIEYLVSSDEYHVCYATGSLFRPAIIKLESIGLNVDEKLIAASDFEYERAKIVKNAIDLARMKYNIEDFERVISVGDGLWDLRTAELLSVEFIGIDYLCNGELSNNGAKLVLEDLTEFIDFL